jgi:HEAT repeat protein
MPRETTRKLWENSERLLVAGAHLAQGNADLARDKTALEGLVAKLGAKAPPVFARLAQQIDRTTTAKPNAQASELITLMTQLAAVRSGLAQLAPAGEDEALEPAPDVETLCNAKDLYALHDALVTKGSGRLEKIEGAVERGDVADLRLVHAVIQAMSDSYVGDTVSDKVVPRFGRAVVDPIRKKLRFPGKKVDGRRLRALVAVEKEGARDVVEQAIREGSADVRAAALDALADHMPGVPAFEAVSLAILASERSGDVRRAAVRALAGYASDASLERLFEALHDDRTVREAAEALGTSRHPDIVTRLLADLETVAEAAKARVKAGDKDATAKREAKKRHVRYLLGALTNHPDARVPKVARAMLDDYGVAAARVVTRQGTPDDLRAIAELLHETESSLFAPAVEALAKLPPEEAVERASKVLVAKDRDSKIGKQRLAALVSARFAPSGPSGERWLESLLAFAKKHKDERPAGTISLLGAMKDKRAVEPLLAALEAEKKAEDATEIIGVLADLGDQRVVPAILAHVKTDNWQLGWAARRAVVSLADETSVGQVRTIYAGLKNPEKNWVIRNLLQALEHKFPGH